MRTIGISFLVFCLTSGVFPFFKSPAAAGQKENSSKAAESKPEKAAAEKSTITVLATIILSASDLRIQLEGKKKEFQSAKTEEQKTKLKGEIEELNQKLGSFAKNFEKISTAVDLEAFAEEPEEVFDWKKEIQSIIGPIVQQIRGMTERPRRIEKLLTVIGATSAFVIVLYISGDWVLLILAVIFLLGIAWTAKRGLPVFWEQIKLLLNLSTVRENERVVYNGIPWRVVSLNIYSRLENPALENAKIRLLASK